MSFCAIIAAGQIINKESILQEISKADLVISADGGYDFLASANITPDFMIGDFDSVITPVNMTQNKIIRLNKEKDDTDTQHALKFALDKGFQNIVIYGGTGDRLDHTIANIGLLYFGIKKRVNIKLSDGNSEIFCITDQESVQIWKNKTPYFSLLSMFQSCEGVYIKGAKYPLNNAILNYDMQMGVSNIVLEDFAEISLKKGILIIFQYKTLK